MSIETYLFFFLTLCYIINLIPGMIDHYCIMENVKRNQETIKTMYPKTHESYKNSNSPYAGEVAEEHKRGEDTVTFPSKCIL